MDFSTLNILTIFDYYGLSCKKINQNQYKTLCCFHNERTPSLTLYLKNNRFFCFGCGASGDVVSFVMQMENIDFAPALQVIKKIYDLDTTSHHQPAEQRSKREIAPPPTTPKIINTDNHIVYNDLLAYCATIPNKTALDYLTKERGLNREILHKANIQTFETAKLQSYLKQKYSYADLQKFGLSINLTNYQIVIPYYHNNKIANLQFRSLCPNDDTKKYKFLYDKPRFNYNLDSLIFLENNDFCQNTRIGITEGVIDCLTVYQLCKEYKLELDNDFICNEVLSLHSGNPNKTEIKELLSKLQAKNLLVTFFIDNDTSSSGTGQKLKNDIETICKEINFDNVVFFTPNDWKDVNEFYVSLTK
jgi:DNA primase